MQDHIFIKGARENNLKNIDVTVPTVERGFLLVVFWSMEIAGLRPSI